MWGMPNAGKIENISDSSVFHVGQSHHAPYLTSAPRTLASDGELITYFYDKTAENFLSHI